MLLIEMREGDPHMSITASTLGIEHGTLSSLTLQHRQYLPHPLSGRSGGTEPVLPTDPISPCAYQENTVLHVPTKQPIRGNYALPPWAQSWVLTWYLA